MIKKERADETVSYFVLWVLVLTVTVESSNSVCYESPIVVEVCRLGDFGGDGEKCEHLPHPPHATDAEPQLRMTPQRQMYGVMATATEEFPITSPDLGILTFSLPRL